MDGSIKYYKVNKKFATTLTQSEVSDILIAHSLSKNVTVNHS